MSDDNDFVELVIRAGRTMNQYAAIVLTGINDGLTPQQAVDFATMEWGQHPEWDWVVERDWEAWGGSPDGLEEALLRLAKFIAAQPARPRPGRPG